MQEAKKLAVLFPGIGYHCDKPLLYYSGKLLKGLGYETVPVPYGNFPQGVFGSEEKKRESLERAVEQAEKILEDVSFAGRDEIVLVGKSIGTIVSGILWEEKQAEASPGTALRTILFTPLAETFPHVHGTAAAFHGTADPWAETEEIRRACRELGIPLMEAEGANHSLETGDVLRDIRTLRQAMECTRRFLAGEDMLRDEGRLKVTAEQIRI